MMSIAEDMRDAMIECIASRGGGVSFVELVQAADAVGTARGDFEISIGRNVVLWSSVSEEFAAAVELLRTDSRVKPAATSVLVYMIDGGFLDLPIVKRTPRNGYKKPHWLPLVFWLKE